MKGTMRYISVLLVSVLLHTMPKMINITIMKVKDAYANKLFYHYENHLHVRHNGNKKQLYFD